MVGYPAAHSFPSFPFETPIFFQNRERVGRRETFWAFLADWTIYWTIYREILGAVGVGGSKEGKGHVEVLPSIPYVISRIEDSVWSSRREIRFPMHKTVTNPIAPSILW
jgi:hypothetical protein